MKKSKIIIWFCINFILILTLNAIKEYNFISFLSGGLIAISFCNIVNINE